MSWWDKVKSSVTPALNVINPAGVLYNGAVGKAAGDAIFGSTPQGIGAYQAPNVPSYSGTTDSSGYLKSAYNYTPGTLPKNANYGYEAGQLDLDKYGKSAGAQNSLNSMYERANSTGDSPWAKLQLERMQIEGQQAREDAQAQSAAGAAGAMSQLAMRGGMSGGARERTLASAQRDLSRNQASLARQDSVNRLNLRATDDQQRLALQQAVQGIDLQDRQFSSSLDQYNLGAADKAAQFNNTMDFNRDSFNVGARNDASKFNIGNRIGDLNAKNSHKMSSWELLMKDQANHANANAIAKSGGKGGILGSFGF